MQSRTAPLTSKNQEYFAKYSQIAVNIQMTAWNLVRLGAVRCCKLQRF